MLMWYRINELIDGKSFMEAERVLSPRNSFCTVSKISIESLKLGHETHPDTSHTSSKVVMRSDLLIPF